MPMVATHTRFKHLLGKCTSRRPLTTTNKAPLDEEMRQSLWGAGQGAEPIANRLQALMKAAAADAAKQADYMVELQQLAQEVLSILQAMQKGRRSNGDGRGSEASNGQKIEL